MSAKEEQRQLVAFWSMRCRQLLQERSNLNRDDLEYVVGKLAAMKDDRLKECVTTLIGWGDDERAELETFVAIALEVMKLSTPSKIRQAATTVELRYEMEGISNGRITSH